MAASPPATWPTPKACSRSMWPRRSRTGSSTAPARRPGPGVTQVSLEPWSAGTPRSGVSRSVWGRGDPAPNERTLMEGRWTSKGRGVDEGRRRGAFRGADLRFSKRSSARRWSGCRRAGWRSSRWRRAGAARDAAHAIRASGKAAPTGRRHGCKRPTSPDAPTSRLPVGARPYRASRSSRSDGQRRPSRQQCAGPWMERGMPREGPRPPSPSERRRARPHPSTNPNLIGWDAPKSEPSSVIFRGAMAERDVWSVRVMCRVLGVSASGCRAPRSRPEGARSRTNRALLKAVSPGPMPRAAGPDARAPRGSTPFREGMAGRAGRRRAEPDRTATRPRASTTSCSCRTTPRSTSSAP